MAPQHHDILSNQSAFKRCIKEDIFIRTDIKNEDFKLPEFEIFIELTVSGSGMMY